MLSFTLMIATLLAPGARAAEILITPEECAAHLLDAREDGPAARARRWVANVQPFDLRLLNNELAFDSIDQLIPEVALAEESNADERSRRHAENLTLRRHALVSDAPFERRFTSLNPEQGRALGLGGTEVPLRNVRVGLVAREGRWILTTRLGGVELGRVELDLGRVKLAMGGRIKAWRVAELSYARQRGHEAPPATVERFFDNTGMVMLFSKLGDEKFAYGFRAPITEQDPTAAGYMYLEVYRYLECSLREEDRPQLVIPEDGNPFGSTCLYPTHLRLTTVPDPTRSHW